MTRLSQITLSPDAHKHLWIVKILSPFNHNTFPTAINGVAYIGYSAGLKISELLDLRKQDVFFDKKMLFVREGKGEKDRATLLSDSLVVDLRYIQTFLGHESSKTTEIYTHVTKKSLAKIKNPLDTILSYK